MEFSLLTMQTRKRAWRHTHAGRYHSQHLIVETKPSTQTPHITCPHIYLSWPPSQRKDTWIWGLLSSLFLCKNKAETFLASQGRLWQSLAAGECLSKSGTPHLCWQWERHFVPLTCEGCVSLHEQNNSSETARGKYWAKQSASKRYLACQNRSQFRR